MRVNVFADLLHWCSTGLMLALIALAAICIVFPGLGINPPSRFALYAPVGGFPRAATWGTREFLFFGENMMRGGPEPSTYYEYVCDKEGRCGWIGGASSSKGLGPYNASCMGGFDRPRESRPAEGDSEKLARASCDGLHMKVDGSMDLNGGEPGGGDAGERHGSGNEESAARPDKESMGRQVGKELGRKLEGKIGLDELEVGVEALAALLQAARRDSAGGKE
jgi:hypothetical protein